MDLLQGTYALYFKSRKHFSDKRTWSKEKMPNDWTKEELQEIAKLTGIQGYAVVTFVNGIINEIHILEWL